MRHAHMIYSFVEFSKPLHTRSSMRKICWKVHAVSYDFDLSCNNLPVASMQYGS